MENTPHSMRSLQLQNKEHNESFVLAMGNAGIDFNKYDLKTILQAHQAYLFAPVPDNRIEYALKIFNRGR
jgi:hypothetical protein